MEVGEVRDAKPFELVGKSLDLDLDDALSQPPRLEPAPCEAHHRDESCGYRYPDQPFDEHCLPSDTVSLGVASSDGQLVRDGSDGHHVPLEPELRVVEPGGDADELREVQHRHLEVLPRLLPELELPRVQGEMA